MLVQLGLCRTWSKTILLVFPRGGSFIIFQAHHAEEALKREWLGKDGEKEKGAKFNEQLQIVVK